MRSLPREFFLLFLVFLTSFIGMKTIFIIFFSTPFDPAFILHLSPLILFPSVSDIQLLFASLTLVVLNLYFHLRSGRFDTIASIIITSIMAGGLSISILSSESYLNITIEYPILVLMLVMLATDIRFLLRGEIKTFPSIFPRREAYAYAPSSSIGSRIPSDLVMLEDMNEEYINLLRGMGIRGIDDLARMDAKDLLKRLHEYMKEIEENISNVTGERVEKWISTARSLVNERDKLRNL